MRTALCSIGCTDSLSQGDNGLYVVCTRLKLPGEFLLSGFPGICVQGWFHVNEMILCRLKGTDIEFAFVTTVRTAADKRVHSDDVALPFLILSDQAFGRRSCPIGANEGAPQSRTLRGQAGGIFRTRQFV